VCPDFQTQPVQGGPHLGNELERFSIVVNAGDIAANNDAYIVPIFKPPYAITVKRVFIGVDTAIVVHNTEYQTVKLTDGSNTIATVGTGPTIGGQAFTAGIFVELAVVTTYAVVTAAEQLYLEFVKTGTTGMAMSNLCIQIDYEINDPA
jgi:hypothetical protein